MTELKLKLFPGKKFRYDNLKVPSPSLPVNAGLFIKTV